jgi:hypothetical protein
MLVAAVIAIEIITGSHEDSKAQAGTNIDE